MSLARVLIAGCGYVGTALGRELAADGHDVWGLRRRTAGLPPTIRAVAADLGVPASLRELPRDLDFAFYLASPGGPDEALYRAAYVDGLRNLLQALEGAGKPPKRVFFASSTGVYAQRKGEWVDEGSPAEPSHFSGRRLLEAEAMLEASPFPCAVVRFGGIYGPRRQRLIDRVRTGQAIYHKGPPRYTNRIHRDDCAGVLRHLMGVSGLDDLYLGVDCEPAEEREVYQWLAGTLGAPEPRPALRDELRGPRDRGSKRCRNDRLLATGYAFRYPTFREGYRALIRSHAA